MYPDRELIGLALHRKILRRRIARRRSECVAAAATLARPIAWLDRVVDFWRKLSPLTQIALPSLGALAVRKAFPGQKILNLLLRWGPVAAGALRGLKSTSARR